MQKRAAYTTIALEIFPGGDVRLCPDLLEALEDGRALTLAEAAKYVLLELPPQGLPRIEGLVGDLAMRGITLVLSHPERNPEFVRKPERLAQLVECGCLLQLTGASFLGEFGRGAKRLAEHLLRAGLAHVVASDAHSGLRHRRSPEFPKVFERLVAMAGEDVAWQLLSVNPAALVRGQKLQTDLAMPLAAEQKAVQIKFAQ